MASPLPQLSVLVPVYNNEMTLRALVDRLHQALGAFDYELIIVDDGSTDGSLAVLKELASGDPRLRLVSFTRNFGQHPAIAAALDHARGDVLILMDADLEDRPEQIPALVKALADAQCDAVYTVIAGALTTARSLTSDAYHQVFSRAVGVALPRHLGTFRAFTRKVRDALVRFPERHVLYGPLMFYVGFRSIVVPVERGTRPGRSSYSFAKRLRLAANSLITYSSLPPTLFAVLGSTMVALPLLYGAIVLAQRIVMGQRLPNGLTIVVLLLSLMSGIIMLALGVLGIYIFRIFQEVLARPRYVIDETWNLGDPADGRP